jgi:dihydroorotate dehydrogenase
VVTGGVFNASDAQAKFKAGPNLLQLITGMIFEGPQVIGEINRELSRNIS